jgi:hypothetical protein
LVEPGDGGTETGSGEEGVQDLRGVGRPDKARDSSLEAPRRSAGNTCRYCTITGCRYCLTHPEWIPPCSESHEP